RSFHGSNVDDAAVGKNFAHSRQPRLPILCGGVQVLEHIETARGDRHGGRRPRTAGSQYRRDLATRRDLENGTATRGGDEDGAIGSDRETAQVGFCSCVYAGDPSAVGYRDTLRERGDQTLLIYLSYRVIFCVVKRTLRARR